MCRPTPTVEKAEQTLKKKKKTQIIHYQCASATRIPVSRVPLHYQCVSATRIPVSLFNKTSPLHYLCRYAHTSVHTQSNLFYTCTCARCQCFSSFPLPWEPSWSLSLWPKFQPGLKPGNFRNQPSLWSVTTLAILTLLHGVDHGVSWTLTGDCLLSLAYCLSQRLFQ